MKRTILMAAAMMTWSFSAAAMPASTPSLVAGLVGTTEFQTIISSQVSFDSVEISRVSPIDVTEQVRIACTGGSRSGSLMKVTIKKDGQEFDHYFGTFSLPEDLALCAQ